MNRWVASFCRKIIVPALYKKRCNLIKNSFKLNKQNVDYYKKSIFLNTEDLNEIFIYKDESWNAIKSIYKLMWNDLFKYKFLQYSSNEINQDNSCLNNKVLFHKNELECKSSGKDNDWIFLLVDKELNEDYLIEFNAILQHTNTEFQIAFNYNSIGCRYRFNLVNNRTLSFDVVNDGFFYNKIFTVPFSLDTNVMYNFKLIVKDNTYSYIVNDTCILSVIDQNKIIKKGKPVLILWDSKKSNIDVRYKDINIYSI